MTISSAWWHEYPWKNELKMQAERVVSHMTEALDDGFEAEHDPYAMLERALALAGFAIRRMIEKRLVTDRFAQTTISIRSFSAVSSGFRQPYFGASGGGATKNYDFSGPIMQGMKPGELANEIIHSSQLMVISKDENASDGILIASDWHQKNRVLHLTAEEFMAYVQAVLDDDIRTKTDSWDPKTGKVVATRQ